ncbi:hypothetical protein [Actinoplanes couchii]|uniref:Uncharacterized protein n=1 Tax=Actinoplanes couchii TaxID=403638 RepID=A0ABQ3XKM4_9ACTN|nr:hypothetical protein [Actinoplanes couchii]MDR6319562.1 hypothetical protein [Actinoplanes couchii]GID59048.1 hypothetical protein Aco03nite_074520 [Actinoplanes couchii]
MRTDVENDLTRTLRAAFASAPPVAPGFPETVTRRRGQRRRRRAAAITGLAAVLLAITGVVTVRPAAESLPADAGPVRDVRAVWPEAVVTLPPLTGGDVRYQVEAALGDGVYLVRPERGAPVLLDGAKVRRLDGIFPADWPGDLGITANHIVWSMATGDGVDVYVQPWRDDGPAVHLGRLPAMDVAVTESGDAFYAVGSTKSGNLWTHRLYRLAAGQEPVPVAAGDGYVLVDGPWAVSGVPQPGAANRLPRVWEPYPSLASVLTAPRSVPTYRNVVTGQTATPVSRASIISCAVAACAGHDGGAVVFWDATGANEVRTGFTLDLRDRADAFFDTSGRFVQVTTRTPRESTSTTTGSHLWDRTTGAVATVRGEMAYDVIDLGFDGGKTVLDLTRIR